MVGISPKNHGTDRSPPQYPGHWCCKVNHVQMKWNDTTWWWFLSARLPQEFLWASLVAEMLKICLQCRRPGFRPWVGKNAWRKKWLPTHYSCLKNAMNRGGWQGTVHGVAKSWTWLSDFTFTFHFHALEKAMATHSSTLAWRIPGTEEPSGLPSMGSHKVRHNWSNLAAAVAAVNG